ncbi:unnamed protein product [Amoebophrya sp. A25]|nr:unnamed protein product [Amoebophrya sp. A25]|eukprot:GSA25T00019314001.1
MLLFPSLFRWPQNVSALHSRRERRGGLLWRAGPSALRSGGTVALLSSAFSLTPLHIRLYYAAARQMKHRDDQDTPWDREPPDMNGGGEATDTDIPEDEDPHKAASFVVLSTGEAERSKTAAGDIEAQIKILAGMIEAGAQEDRRRLNEKVDQLGLSVKALQEQLQELSTRVAAAADRTSAQGAQRDDTSRRLEELEDELREALRKLPVDDLLEDEPASKRVEGHPDPHQDQHQLEVRAASQETQDQLRQRGQQSNANVDVIPDSSSTSRSAEIHIIPSPMSSTPSFIGYSTLKGQINAQPLQIYVGVGLSEVPPARDYFIKFKVEGQSSEQTVWPLTEQLALLKDKAVLEKLCRHHFVDDEQGTTSKKFGVASKQEFEKQIQKGDESSPVFRHVRVSAFSERLNNHPGALSYDHGIDDDAVRDLAHLLGRTSLAVEFVVECQAESSATLSSGSKTYERYSSFYVKFQRKDL